MRKWMGLIAGTLSVLTSTLRADDVLTSPAEDAQIMPVESVAAPTDVTTNQQQTPKQVGKASADSMNMAKSSNTTKYVLAAGAVVIGVTALILVSRHHGHH